VLRLLQFLEEYVKEHFVAQEKLQLQHGYPEYQAHKSLHTRFSAEVARLTASFRAEGATLMLVILTNKTLVSWLVQHISKTDMEFASYLHAKGGA